MIERFQGADGAARLVESLRKQRCIQDDEGVARVIAAQCSIHAYSSGDMLISQGGSDNDLFLILAGKVRICVNGREVAQRVAGEHVGEMAVIDPSARRSADAIAADDVVAAKISESTFISIADGRPRIWRFVACELANRLRQRGDHVRPRNVEPRLFIGSSRESLAIAQGIQSGLAHDSVVATVWTDKVFGPSQYSLESLEVQLERADFAAIVVGPDDRVWSRGEFAEEAPRDNVVFELGFFMGVLGRRRVLMVKPRGVDLKIPSDLLGLQPVEFRVGAPADLASLLAPACTEIRDVIRALGPR